MAALLCCCGVLLLAASAAFAQPLGLGLPAIPALGLPALPALPGQGQLPGLALPVPSGGGSSRDAGGVVLGGSSGIRPIALPKQTPPPPISTTISTTGGLFDLLLGGTLGAPRGSSGSRARNPPPHCTPFTVPPQFKGIQAMCESLKKDPGSKFDEMYRKGAKASTTSGYPLKGCVAGCVIGDTRGARIASSPWNAGAWSGKCFNRWETTRNLPVGVSNIITPNKDSMEWSKGLPGVLAYPADVLVKSSLVDGEPTWIIDYTNSPNFGGRSISYFEDEMREVAPGVVMGKAFIKPYGLPYNPTPATIEALNFILFQTCDRDGGYPDTPAARVIP